MPSGGIAITTVIRMSYIHRTTRLLAATGILSGNELPIARLDPVIALGDVGQVQMVDIAVEVPQTVLDPPDDGRRVIGRGD